jgi:hypothetical protein
MVQQMIDAGMSAGQAAVLARRDAATARKWLGRFLAGGQSAWPMRRRDRRARRGASSQARRC